MPKVHFLNVKNGDCSIIQRDGTDRITMIDICCGNIEIEDQPAKDEKIAPDRSPFHKLSVNGNFNMKLSPTNPIEYLEDNDISSIHRFILTHPDMDHMDGIASLFDAFPVYNFWDNGIRREKPNFARGPYLEEDWNFYTKLINKQIPKTTVVSPKAGDKNKFWNRDENGNDGGDYLYILAPDKGLINEANETGNINDGSYVIVYRSSAGSIIFAGDSEDSTWDYILNNHSKTVENAAVLIAPHHGRDSDRDWTFLDIVNPRVTLIGNARSHHLNYTKYNEKSNFTVTNNQAGNIRIDINGDYVWIEVENESYAKATGIKYRLNNGMWRLDKAF